jgi:uncharacterized membrane protein YkvA (DUF1232 family)
VQAGELVALVPDAVVLCRRLLRDPRVPRRAKLALLALVPYLASPIDLIPDFIPVLGYLDDAALVAFVLRYLVRTTGGEVVQELAPPRLAAVLSARAGGT